MQRPIIVLMPPSPIAAVNCSLVLVDYFHLVSFPNLISNLTIFVMIIESMTTKRLFDNTETAFKLKTDAQLERSYFLFKMIANEPLVKIGTAVTKFALNVHLPVEGLIRSTVFDHFCGGVNEKDCMPVVDNLMEARVYSVLDYSVEGKEEAAQFDATMEKVVELTQFAEKTSDALFGLQTNRFGQVQDLAKGYGTSGLIQFGSSGMEAYPRAL